MHIQQLRQNLPLDWVCKKGEKEEEIPPFSPAVISLITSLSKGHSINKNVLFVHFMQVTLKVLDEIEVLLHFFGTKTSKYLLMPKRGEKEQLQPQPRASSSSSAGDCPGSVQFLSSLCPKPSQAPPAPAPLQVLPSTLSHIGRSQGHKIVFYSLLSLLIVSEVPGGGYTCAGCVEQCRVAEVN